MTSFTGVQVLALEADSLIPNKLYETGRVSIEVLSTGRELAFPNSFFVLKYDGQPSLLARVSPDGKDLLLIRQDKLEASGIRPRNKEQAMALSTLLDDKVPVQILAGKAGTGKTLLTLAAAMAKIEERVYDKIILTKPMSQVGQYDLGILPGTIEEKFAPFLINYASNVEQLLGNPDPGHGKRTRKKEETESGLKGVMADFFNHYRVEMVPLQLLRGASFQKAFIIADEIQVLGHHEMLTLGTRVAAGSKLVLMGDLDQRDEKIARTATGLHKIITDPKMQASPLVSYLELLKVERGPVAELFSSVFEAPST
jgi:PhoH-like ATPase